MWWIVQALSAAGEDGITLEEAAKRTGLAVEAVATFASLLDTELSLMPVHEENGRYGLADETLARTFLLTPGQRAALQAVLEAAPNLDLERPSSTGWLQSPTFLMKGHGATYITAQTLRWVILLERAIDNRQCVLLVTTSSRKKRRRTLKLEPLGLVASPAGWHLVARQPGHKRYDAPYPLDHRMVHVESMEEPFVYPEGFDVREEFRWAWGVEGGVNHRIFDVVVAFFDEARVFERVKFETAHRRDRKIEVTSAGTMLYRDRVQGLGEFMRWLRSFGASVVALGPPELYDGMRRSAYRLLSRYEEPHQADRLQPG